MNVTAHQEKEKNEETRTDMKKTGEKKHATDFIEVACCSSAVVQGAAQRKNKWEMSVVTGTLGKANRHFDSTQTGSGTAPPR